MADNPLFAKINKEAGGAVISLASDSAEEAEEVVPTGLAGVDKASGVGGIPIGTVIEVFGQFSAGKTGFANQVVSAFQAHGHKVAFIDMEHDYNRSLAKRAGVDLNTLAFSQPDYGEQALEVVRTLVESGEYSLIVVDSIATLLPLSMLEGNMDDASMGVQAKMMSQALMRLKPLLLKQRCTILFTNQMRKKLDGYGNPNITAGGEAMKYYATMRAEISRKPVKEKGDTGDTIGQEVTVYFVKNKFAPPFKKGSYTLKYASGIDFVGDFIAEAVSMKIVEQKGAWYFYKGEQISQGKEGIKEWLVNNPDKKAEIEKALLGGGK